MACEILTLVRDYNPDHSRAVSRTRAATLLAKLRCDSDAESGRSMPAPVANHTAQEIAQILLTIHLEKMPDTGDNQL